MSLPKWKALAAGIAMSLLAAGVAGATPTQPAGVTLQPFKLAADTVDILRADMVEQLQAKHPAGTWAPMKMRLSDEHLALLGLPPAEVLKSQQFDEPTM